MHRVQLKMTYPSGIRSRKQHTPAARFVFFSLLRTQTSEICPTDSYHVGHERGGYLTSSLDNGQRQEYYSEHDSSAKKKCQVENTQRSPHRDSTMPRKRRRHEYFERRMKELLAPVSIARRMTRDRTVASQPSAPSDMPLKRCRSHGRKGKKSEQLKGF